VGFAANLGAMLPGVTKFGPRLSAAVLAKPGDRANREWSEGLIGTLRAMRDEVVAERLRLIARCDVRSELAALRIPVVLAQFERDRVLSRRVQVELESVCHNAAIVNIDAPHFALEVQPEACAAAIASTLGTLLSRPLRPVA
jgi:pimeloyl-ACP methyl ester carboxylesterase